MDMGDTALVEGKMMPNLSAKMIGLLVAWLVGGSSMFFIFENPDTAIGAIGILGAVIIMLMLVVD